MHFGLEDAAKVIYDLYAWQCHQLPQRSYFLFGERMSYTLERIQSVWIDTFDPMILRQFIGNADIGYKVAWSDRMISAYSSLPLTALLLRQYRSKAKPISVGLFALLIAPMAIDGITHMISDLEGIGQGFRYTNTWLAVLTDYNLHGSFYYGDALGSFNSWMRIITGLLFGIGTIAFAYPYISQAFEWHRPTSAFIGDHHVDKSE